MRFIPTLSVALSLSLLSHQANAADLSGAEITGMILGKTVYFKLETPGASAGNAIGALYYADEKTVTFKTPKGDIWHGAWKIMTNTVCIDWKEQPSNGCTRYDKQGDTITLIRADNNIPRGKLMKIEPGNPESSSLSPRAAEKPSNQHALWDVVDRDRAEEALRLSCLSRAVGRGPVGQGSRVANRMFSSDQNGTGPPMPTQSLRPLRSLMTMKWGSVQTAVSVEEIRLAIAIASLEPAAESVRDNKT